jgi:hypothetical protein
MLSCYYMIVPLVRRVLQCFLEADNDIVCAWDVCGISGHGMRSSPDYLAQRSGVGASLSNKSQGRTHKCRSQPARAPRPAVLNTHMAILDNVQCLGEPQMHPHTV